MKVITVILVIVAALAANSKSSPDEDSALQAQQLGEIALADVDDHEMHKPHNDLNKEMRGQNEKNGTRTTKECEDVPGGECKKEKKCIKENKFVDTKIKCDNQKHVCCYSEINQCVAVLGFESILSNKVDSSEITIIEAIDQGNNDITRVLENIQMKVDTILQNQEGIITCPDKFVLIQECCYYFSSDYGLKKTWKDARKACQDMVPNGNGDLAEAGSLPGCDVTKFMLTVREKDVGVWLGASDEAQEDTWLWNSGGLIPLSSFMWEPTYSPNGGTNENCLISWRWDYKFNRFYLGDNNCQAENSYICQIF